MPCAATLLLWSATWWKRHQLTKRRYILLTYILCKKQKQKKPVRHLRCYVSVRPAGGALLSVRLDHDRLQRRPPGCSPVGLWCRGKQLSSPQADRSWCCSRSRSLLPCHTSRRGRYIRPLIGLCRINIPRIDPRFVFFGYIVPL